MTKMKLDDERLTLECGSRSAVLLAKEYALLRYLYDNANRVFSRDQLLDRVWAGEYPVDRTVDDHVYRLRRKLKEVGGPAIETVRGVGYSLALPPEAEPFGASLRDPDVQAAMNGVFERYHRLGEGRAMFALAGQQRELGFEVDSFYRSYLRFMQSDLRWFLETEDVPMRERFYWLLLFYIFADTPEPKAAICERALKLDAMREEQQLEMRMLNIADLYAAEGRIEEAKATLAFGRRTAAERGMDGFVIALETAGLYVSLLAGDRTSAAEQSKRIAELLRTEPYLRELASYRMLEGTRLLLESGGAIGEEDLREGLAIFERSGFASHRLLALQRICSALRKRLPDHAVTRRYSAELKENAERFGLSALHAKLAAVIGDHLDGLENSRRDA
ncbi:transcriptional regulator [Saccharibacillus sp. O23]|uniref:winged helix-turn-helix domain-containing protein n=1 Tax=Saccharibacillus sp. O23 TaxID=2009338 RepID=UPI000B4E3775|nr:winged helix-turn-helix domain-containing protein [Saccharibacillus sp. O23]OWR31726.1 transcriptional regulator [Saccharibacillus sp. O23]